MRSLNVLVMVGLLQFLSLFPANAGEISTKISECESRHGFIVYSSPNRKTRLQGNEACAAIEALDQMLDYHTSGFRYCYERLLTTYPSLGLGEVVSLPLTFQWSEGSISPVQIVRNESYEVKNLRACVHKRLLQIKVPSDFQSIIFTGNLKFHQR